MTRRDIVVVGGGLAGITAALRLADTGATVTLVEARPRLGGLTTSFTRHSPVGSIEVDTGTHVFLRCCTAYRQLLQRLDVVDEVTVQPRLDVPVVRVSDGRRARLRRGRLPVLAGVPLHLAPALLGYRLLGVGDRVAASRAARALRRLDPADPETDRCSFGDWLTRHGQSERAVTALWDLIGTATLNARAADASLALAATVFQLGLLTNARAADIGWPNVPLQRLHGAAALNALQQAGVDVRLRCKVAALEPSRMWTVRCTDGSSLSAAGCIVATDPVTTERLIPADALPTAPGWSQRLGATPILNAHFILDRPVLNSPMLALPGSPLQWLFDRTRVSGAHRAGPQVQHVVASISAADGYAARPVSRLRAEFTAALHRAIPAAASARLLDFFVTREPRATWRQAPGTAADRPPAATRLPGLALAGAHTQTGWPATMEGAVRSGEAAARLFAEASARAPAHPLSDHDEDAA